MPEDVRDVQQLSVQDRTEEGFAQESPLVFYLASLAEQFPAWPSPQRDIELAKFWRTEPTLAGAVYSMVAKVAALDFKLHGPGKAVSRYKRVLMQADLGRGWPTFVQKVVLDYLCLAGRSRVQLGGARRGQTKTIAQIVKDRDPGPVLTTDVEGHIVERPITEWVATPLGPRQWWWLSLQDTSGHSRERAGGLFLTEDHPVRTPTGWVEARNVHPGMRVASGDPAPSDEQAELLAGTLLGDAALGKPGHRALLRLTQGDAQREWLDLKMHALRGFSWTGYRAYHKGPHPVWGVNSRVTAGLSTWYAAWYPHGRKVVARELVARHFSPRMLAAWFCDDGTQHRAVTRAGNPTTSTGTLCTHGFSGEDVDWLVGLLNAHGYTCSRYDHRHGGRTYPTIHLPAEGYRQVVAAVAPYVPPCARHKLPDDAPTYDPGLWELAPATVHYSEVVACEPRDYTSGGRVVQTTYHIGVQDTRNFIAANTVVHNTQDNGGFIEIIRPRRGGPTTPVVGVAHLDAQRCRRTGDIRAPIDYVDAKGTPHRLKWYEVLPMTDLPSPREQHHGVGFCAVSRILRAAQTLRDIGIYKRQKLSGKRPPGLLFVQGLRKGTIESALQEAQQAQMERGDTLYTGPIILASQDPGQAVDVKLIELAGLPDHYDEDTTLKWYISQLALAFGTDYTEFAPLPGGGLGSGQQTTEMAARARGKGPGVALQQLEFGLNYYVLPPSVEFQFASTDPTAERDRVQLRYERGRERALRVSSGELTPQQALELAVEEGDAPEKFLQGYAEPDDPLEAIVREVGALRQTTQEMERLARNAPRPAKAPRAPLWRRVLGGGG